MGAAVQKEVSGVGLTVPVFQFQGDGLTKVATAAAGSDKPTVYRKQPGVVFTNDQYFQLLPYRWIAGSSNAAMKDPFSVVLAESRARQYFPNLPLADIPGKMLTYNDNLRVTVSGIVNDLHENSSFAGMEFISLPTISQTNLKDDFMMSVWDDWMAYSHLYVKLEAGVSPERTERQLKGLVTKYSSMGKPNSPNTMAFHLQPLKDVHFNPGYQAFDQRVSTLPTLYGLMAIAAFILLLGCINFINLSTARASRRAKEIGVRKTMGSSRGQLVMQFLGETLFTVCLATAVSISVTPLLLRAFADFIPPGLHTDFLRQPAVMLFGLVLVAGVSLLSGIYPAFVLSGFNPVMVLKNQFFTVSGQRSGVWIRKTLTVSQFVIAQFFIIATLLVSKQIHYALSADMGFSKQATLTLETPFDSVLTHRMQLLTEIKSIPEVEMASVGLVPPIGGSMTNIKMAGGEDVHAPVQLRLGDSNYLKLYQVKIIAGRNVRQSDTIREFLINETYARLLGFRHPEEALGRQLVFNAKNYPIVGILQDFHEQSLHEAIGPLVFAGSPGPIFHIRLMPRDASGENWKNGIAKIHNAFLHVYPDADFEYAFLDDTIAKWYESEKRVSHLLSWATGLTIFISCLGLLGLVLYTTDRRAKEIGIRKVLGASVTHIVSILSAEFIRLVALAFLIAAPLAGWASYAWLENFVYRTEMSWWIFALSGITLLLFALITLSIQTIRSATANPVESLRSE